jgi:hypothetical protein
MSPKKSVTDAVAGTIEPSISFKEFAKEPVKGLLLIVCGSIKNNRFSIIK